MRTEDGLQPVKLKVKEYLNEGQDIPANIKAVLGGDYETFASAYDNRVLLLDEIEKETSGSVGLAAGEAATPSDPEVSTVNVADLYSLVNREYMKYLPQPGDEPVGKGGTQFSEDQDDDTNALRQELRERGNVEARRALADTDRAAFRENEEQRRRIRREIRETKSKPKEIAAMEKELARLRDRDYQHRLLDEGGAEAVTRNAREIARLEQRLERLRGEQETRPARERKKAAKKANAPSISVKQLQNDLLRYFSIPEGQRAELGKFVSAVANKILFIPRSSRSPGSSPRWPAFRCAPQGS